MTNEVIITTSAVSLAKQIGEYTSIGQNVVLAVCGIATVTIAALGLKTWRRQLKGTSEYTKSKEVLKAVYNVRRAFRHVRCAAIYSYEYPEEMRDAVGLKDEHEHAGTAHVYQQRWNILHEAWGRLEEQLLEAQVEWEEFNEDTITPLWKCKVELQIAIQDLLDAKKSYGRQAVSPEDGAKRDSILYYGGKDSKHDKFTPEIEAAIAEFERKLRCHIKK